MISHTRTNTQTNTQTFLLTHNLFALSDLHHCMWILEHACLWPKRCHRAWSMKRLSPPERQDDKDKHSGFNNQSCQTRMHKNKNKTAFDNIETGSKKKKKKRSTSLILFQLWYVKSLLRYLRDELENCRCWLLMEVSIIIYTYKVSHQMNPTFISSFLKKKEKWSDSET